MFMKRALSLILMLLLLFSSVPAFAQTPPVLLDMAGREVPLSQPAKRVVALQAADVEILYALGAGSLLVGRGEYCNYPLEVLGLPSVQSGFETNFEQIIALQPDVVIMTKMNQREDDVKKLEEAGIQVVVSDAQTIEGVYQAITLLGQLAGKPREAEGLVSEMQAAFANLQEKAVEKTGGSVYFEVSPLVYGLWAACKGTFMDEIGALLGLENLFSDLEGWQAVSEEQVLARDPDYIVTTAMYFGEGLKPDEEVLARANWGGIQAVKNQKVFNADSDAITRPGPRLVDAAQALYDFVYGE